MISELFSSTDKDRLYLNGVVGLHFYRYRQAIWVSQEPRWFQKEFPKQKPQRDTTVDLIGFGRPSVLQYVRQIEILLLSLATLKMINRVKCASRAIIVTQG